jgi:hypothetical protein
MSTFFLIITNFCVTSMVCMCTTHYMWSWTAWTHQQRLQMFMPCTQERRLRPHSTKTRNTTVYKCQLKTRLEDATYFMQPGFNCIKRIIIVAEPVMFVLHLHKKVVQLFAVCTVYIMLIEKRSKYEKLLTFVRFAL